MNLTYMNTANAQDLNDSMNSQGHVKAMPSRSLATYSTSLQQDMHSSPAEMLRAQICYYGPTVHA